MLAKNNMVESISSSPAISNGRIYLRTFERPVRHRQSKWQRARRRRVVASASVRSGE